VAAFEHPLEEDVFVRTARRVRNRVAAGRPVDGLEQWCCAIRKSGERR
jgi:hypothetical protein